MCKDIPIVEICDLFSYYRLENDGTIFISPYQVVISYNMLVSISEILRTDVRIWTKCYVNVVIWRH